MPFTLPLDPDQPTAQRWVRDELAKEQYRNQETLLQRMYNWLTGLFDFGPGGSVGVGQVVLILVAIAIVAVLWFSVARWRGVGGPGGRNTGSPVLTERRLPAAEHRRRAVAAEQDGHLEVAVQEWFRYLTRSLEERTVLDERDGRTADEVAHHAGLAFPELVTPLREAANLFDRVSYGRMRASAADVALIAAAADRVDAARPLLNAGQPR